MKTFSDGTPVPMIYLWMGRRVEDLTKEELIEALKYAMRERDDANDRHQMTLDLWRSFREQESTGPVDRQSTTWNESSPINRQIHE